MKIGNLKGFTVNQQKVIWGIVLDDKIKTAYSIEHDNRFLRPILAHLENNKWIIRNEEGYCRLNKEKFDNIWGVGGTDKIIQESRSICGIQNIRKKLKVVTASKNFIKEYQNKVGSLSSVLNGF